MEVNGKTVEVGKNDIFVCPPRFFSWILLSFIGFHLRGSLCHQLHAYAEYPAITSRCVWNRAMMYVDKVSVIRMTSEEMLFYAKFTELVRSLSG